MKLRPYQSAAEAALWRYFERESGNPLVVIPTGGGKSLVQAAFVRNAIERFPETRFLLLTHVKELLKQNGEELARAWPGAASRIGYYSAGLRQRDTDAQITVAGIQSVYKRAHEFGRIHLVMIDEAHLVPPKGEGMYRRFLSELRQLNPGLKVIGMTATPFRLDHGMLHHGKNRIFTDIAYEANVRGLITDGYLSPLKTTVSETEVDLSDVGMANGDYKQGELERTMSAEGLVEATADEMLRLAADRKKWLVFCSGIKHAQVMKEALMVRGVPCAVISGNTPRESREKIIELYRGGWFRALLNVNVLTTGFNVPDIDSLIILRPTKSIGLHVQILGRGMRRAPGKTDCQVLDFAGNTLEHGPIDRIKITNRGEGEKGVQSSPMKQCPGCKELIPAPVLDCPECGHAFPRDFIPKHGTKAVGGDVVSNGAPVVKTWAKVVSVSYSRHLKPGKPPSLRVRYNLGLREVSEWVCLQHPGRVQRKAVAWWRRRGRRPVPSTVDQALQRQGELACPSFVLVDDTNRYGSVSDYKFTEEP